MLKYVIRVTYFMPGKMHVGIVRFLLDAFAPETLINALTLVHTANGKAHIINT